MGFFEAAKQNRFYVRWMLVVYDLCIFLGVCLIMLVLYNGTENMSASRIVYVAVLAFFSIFPMRFAFLIYQQIWRYGGIQSYIRLLVSDGLGFIVFFLLELILPIKRISFARSLALCSLNLLVALAIRMIYRYAYKCGRPDTPKGRFLCWLLDVFGGSDVRAEMKSDSNKIRIAIVGAGRVGTGLAEELSSNSASQYVPRLFVDVDKNKVGRSIFGVPVFSEDQVSAELFESFEIQEVVVSIPSLNAEEKRRMYDFYRMMGLKVKVYDYPVIATVGSRRALREFDIEELLFRKPLDVVDEATGAYYTGKTIMITGGGGSIGAELCRQIARMKPKKLVILDVYENGAYDIQQELKYTHTDLDISIEIMSVCNKDGLQRVFERYRPQIVLHAAAHKHVPLMEHNCLEAIENNVFGTLNIVELCEQYGAERAIMVSTDKAVNPTNVMGATKRMCEMIFQAYSTNGGVTTFSATRFGNVLGSAGSVIPLFRRQIANGGPVTVTDKRIIRYFMTISEASQLVLQSGAMAKNGDLFVLDMGRPVRIYDLAENLIRLSGFEPYKDIDIIEVGLRPGEKLYEELLVKSEQLGKTKNDLIFIEHDEPLTMAEMNEKLAILRDAVASGDEETAYKALKTVVPPFKSPEEVNETADGSVEMREVFAN